ncbi:MarR family winged helix-turn-helix transcriptional regulator [Amantichitinum ursilacus]|uniref:Multiple antibiotic resistance protein MarR n=1 Tax=Amantichitinum ursilacus TaxID=857265 RepID=A0A0N0XG66_9NEIS|nr:MarR family transcriptional regulator [Amantichitinum ursilacus]KPC49782.1 Multiple antibiotic resistance protein MarR [Amantichitinum ursilacus]
MSISQPPEENLGVLVRQVRDGMFHLFEHKLAQSGLELNLSQYLVLKRLAYHGVQTATELARAIDHDAGAMTRLLDKLEEKGYLRRQPHQEDRRALQISLTEAGQALWATMQACGEASMAVAVSDLNDAEQDQLVSLLKRVRNTLESK